MLLVLAATYFFNVLFSLRFFFFFGCRPVVKSFNLLQYCFYFMFWFSGCKACGILVPWPGIEPASPPVEGEVLTTGPLGKSLLMYFNRSRSFFFPLGKDHPFAFGPSGKVNFPEGFPGDSVSKEPTYSVGGLGLIPGLGRSPGEGNGYPLQYPGLEKNSMDCLVRGGLKESDTAEQLSLTYRVVRWCKQNWDIYYKESGSLVDIRGALRRGLELRIKGHLVLPASLCPQGRDGWVRGHSCHTGWGQGTKSCCTKLSSKA